LLNVLKFKLVGVGAMFNMLPSVDDVSTGCVATYTEGVKAVRGSPRFPPTPEADRVEGDVGQAGDAVLRDCEVEMCALELDRLCNWEVECEKPPKVDALGLSPAIRRCNCWPVLRMRVLVAELRAALLLCPFWIWSQVKIK
jgi:hypothetical protein